MLERVQAKDLRNDSSVYQHARSKARLESRSGKGAFVSAAPLPHRVGPCGALNNLRQGQYVQVIALRTPAVEEPARNLSLRNSKRRRESEATSEASIPHWPAACTCMAWSDGRLIVYAHDRVPSVEGNGDGASLSESPGCILVGKWRDDPSLSPDLSLAAMNQLGAGPFLGRITALQCSFDESNEFEPAKRQRSHVVDPSPAANAEQLNRFPAAPEQGYPQAHTRLLIVVGYESGALRLFTVDISRCVDLNASQRRQTKTGSEIDLALTLELCDVCRLPGRIESLVVSAHSPRQEEYLRGGCLQHVYAVCRDSDPIVWALQVRRSSDRTVDGQCNAVYCWSDTQHHRRLRIMHTRGTSLQALAISPTDRYLAVAAGECLSAYELPRWCADAREPGASRDVEVERIWRFTGHSSTICCLAFAGPVLLASAALGDTLISLWRLDQENSSALHSENANFIESPPWRSVLCHAVNSAPASVVQLVAAEHSPEARLPSMKRAADTSRTTNGICSSGTATDHALDEHPVGRDAVSPRASNAADADSARIAMDASPETFLLAVLGDGSAQLFGVKERLSTPGQVSAMKAGEKRSTVLHPQLILQPQEPCFSGASVMRWVNNAGEQQLGFALFYGSLQQPKIVFVPRKLWSQDAPTMNGSESGAARVISLQNDALSKVEHQRSSNVARANSNPISSDSVHTNENTPVLNGARANHSGGILGYAQLPVEASAPSDSERKKHALDTQTMPPSLSLTSSVVADGADGVCTSIQRIPGNDEHGAAANVGMKLNAVEAASHQKTALLPEPVDPAASSANIIAGNELLSLAEQLSYVQQQASVASAPELFNKSSGERPLAVDTVATLIVQALDANDNQLLDRALAAVQTAAGASRTVRKLPARAILSLLGALVARFCSHSVRAPALSLWIRAVIRCHAPFLLSQRDARLPQHGANLQSVREAMVALYYAIEEQRRLREALVRLEGRLELIMAFAQSVSFSGQPQPQQPVSKLRRIIRERPVHVQAQTADEKVASVADTTSSTSTTSSSSPDASDSSGNSSSEESSAL
jgi:hypothetical protein